MQPLAPGSTIGILGTGQLGRMLAIAAARLGLRCHVFGPDDDAPAAEVSAVHTRAAYDDLAALQRFAARCDAVTFEFENVPHASLETLDGSVPLRPGITSLETSQDRLIEKRFVESLGLPVAPCRPIDGARQLPGALKALGGDAILKTRRLGYDGKGQVRLSSAAPLDPESVWAQLGRVSCVLEQRIPFTAEVSAIVVRSADGTSIAYDVPVNVHRQGILHTSSVGHFARPTIPSTTADAARGAAVKIADALGHVGTLAVEFFVTRDGLIVNEIAPRVHNTGHWTLDACQHDQFDNHVRAVAGWPLGSPARFADARMTNLIGHDATDIGTWQADPRCSIHLYGKAAVRERRKMGHVTQLAPLSASPD